MVVVGQTGRSRGREATHALSSSSCPSRPPFVCLRDAFQQQSEEGEEKEAKRKESRVESVGNQSVAVATLISTLFLPFLSFAAPFTPSLPPSPRLASPRLASSHNKHTHTHTDRLSLLFSSISLQVARKKKKKKTPSDLRNENDQPTHRPKDRKGKKRKKRQVVC